MKKMMERQLKDAPKHEKEKIMQIIDKDPDLMIRIAKEVQEKIKQGKDQMAASMEVMKEHEEELKKIMMNQ